MPALSDRSFNPGAWRKLFLVAVGLAGVAGLVWLSSWVHQTYVEAPRLLAKRFEDPLGRVGTTSVLVSELGPAAVPTLLQDLRSKSPAERSKAAELLSTIDDPAVAPALGKALQDGDVGVRLAALGGLARTGKTESAQHIWPMAESPEDLLRLRALVALGVVGSQADADRLLDKEFPRVQGQERYVVAWAGGRILQRLERNDPKGYVPAAPTPVSDADAERIQAEVNAVLAALDAGKDVRANAKRLDVLTDIGFGTWDVPHQVAAQVLAVNGPIALRHVGGSLEMAPPTPAASRLQLQRPIAEPPPP